VTESSTTRSGRPFVFVTGPYRAPSDKGIGRNIDEGIRIGRAVFRKGYYPIVPHLLVGDVPIML